MPGKDLASKLRDFGFSKAKSHMSALDQFELVQAQGLLEANGIMPAANVDGDADAGTGGGLRVKKRKKKAKPAEEPREPDTAESGDDSETKETPVADPAKGLAGLKSRKKSPKADDGGATAEVQPTPAKTKPAASEVPEPASQTESEPPSPATDPGPSGPAATEAPDEPQAEIPTTEPVRATGSEADDLPKGRVARAIAEKKLAADVADAAPAATTRASADAEPVTADAEASTPPDTDAGPTTDESTPKSTEPAASSAAADDGQPSAQSADVESASGAAEAVESKAGSAASNDASTGTETNETSPGDDTATKPEEGKAKDDEDAKPRGNVVGFIDPSNFAQSQPSRRRADSRRLQSRDDATPDVRPTFGRDRNRQSGPTGPRGKMTAAELRDREQGRFLRRNRAAGGPPGRRGGGRGGGSRDQVTESPHAGSKVAIEEPITVAKLSDALSLKSSVVQKRALERQYGMFTLNAALDHDTATLLASEFDVELDVKEEVTAEQQLIEEVAKKRSEVEEENLVARPPTVAFLGHVDHGKTTLIDKIRETKVADREAGGITQHTGAYQVKTAKGHTVTVVDTPGHEAFTAMRARGASAVDIVVLVVAGDDGVKPSTAEAINHAKAAETPIVVALNKADKPEFNANQVIQQLMGHELVPEQYGGNTAMFETSGITGSGIDELLEHIFLMGDAELGLKAHPNGPAAGVVLEAEIEQGRGIVAHLLVQDGTLNKGDVILAGAGYGKVRQLLDDRGKSMKKAGPSTPVSVTGLDALPGVGQPFHVIETLAQAKEIAEERERSTRAVMLASKREPSRELESILGSAPKTEREIINVIVRADVQGSVEVIKQEIESLDHDEVEVRLVHSGVGPITESDVDLATTSEAILIAFHVSVNPKARQEADRMGLTVRRYSVIYELLDDLRRVMEGALKPEFEEEITGHVEIRRLFKSSKIGLIAGCYVLDGTIKRNSKVRLLRDGNVVYTGQIGSLRREKEEANEVRSGFECGIVLKDYRDIRTEDVIEAYRMKEIKRTL